MTDPVEPSGGEQAGSGHAPPRLSGGIGGAVAAGIGGERVSARGLLDTIGGVRGVLESLVPATIYLVAYVLTQDPRISAIAPLVVAVLAIALRLLRKQQLSAALSGLVGVLVCVAATLLTGRGEDYFLPGFWINAAWIAAHTISLVVGWPLIGLLVGFLRGSLTEWRGIPVIRRAAVICTVLWIAVFAARLAVQVPLYLSANAGDAGAVEALGVARLVMGVPLFALAVLFTWLLMSRVSASYDGLRAARQDAESSGQPTAPSSSDE